ncbi:MAG TPA: hypothetical protein VGL22_13865 [Terracidiphilus sp.]|jgi:hypothetical protein
MQRNNAWIAFASTLLVLSAGCKQDAPAAPEASSQSQTSVSTPKPAAKPPSATMKIDNVALVTRRVPEHEEQFEQFATTARNTGGTAAKLDGSCNFTCPAGSGAMNGQMTASKGELLAGGERRTLLSDRVPLCSNQLSGIKLQCSYTVQMMDAGGKPVGKAEALSWSGVPDVRYEQAARAQ